MRKAALRHVEWASGLSRERTFVEYSRFRGSGLSVNQEYRINIIQPGPKPPFNCIAEHLWGPGCNIDLDGNSQTPEDTQWTELTIELRATGERIDIDPISTTPLVLQVRASSMRLAQEVAEFVVKASGGKIEGVA